MVAALLTLLLTSFAQAHPGHFLLDPNGGPPHAGHAGAWSSLLLSMLLTAVLFVVARGVSKRAR
jgi:hypothetical protein